MTGESVELGWGWAERIWGVIWEQTILLGFTLGEWSPLEDLTTGRLACGGDRELTSPRTVARWSPELSPGLAL